MTQSGSSVFAEEHPQIVGLLTTAVKTNFKPALTKQMAKTMCYNIRCGKFSEQHYIDLWTERLKSNDDYTVVKTSGNSSKITSPRGMSVFVTEAEAATARVAP